MSDGAHSHEVGSGHADAPAGGMAATIGLAHLVPLALLALYCRTIHVHVCDDAFISLKAALNLAQGRGLTFNPEQAIYVFTNPLWVLLAAAGRWLTGDLVLAVRWLSFVSEALLVTAIVHLSRKFSADRCAGMLAAVLLISNSSFLLTSFMAMELPLYLLAWVVATDALVSRRWTSALTLAALAVWIRIDGVLLYGVALLYWGWTTRRWNWREGWRWAVVWPVVPSLIVLAGYFAFGKLVFGEWVPMSVQRKALTSPVLFSAEWMDGVRVVGREFLNALIGRHTFWFRTPTAYVYLLIPLAVGLVHLVRRRSGFLVPLGGMTVLYVGSFLVTGSEYAQYSPWYFAPVLPLACLVAGVGGRLLISGACVLLRSNACARYSSAVAWIFALVWAGSAYPPLAWNAEKLRTGTLGLEHRERLYATAAIWAGHRLDRDATVAANEIGAVAFYLRPSQSILDLFGLLSKPEDLGVDYLVRIRRDPPELIVTQKVFPYYKRIRRELGSLYQWSSFGKLAVGVRSDLAPELLSRIPPEFKAIYRGIDLEREYDWSKRRSMVDGHVP